ncbi:MAG TPA: PAS domain-containing protein [Syntrophales bacterium]|nr:PAS domain-containing protein [Syntrophales bacterium]
MTKDLSKKQLVQEVSTLRRAMGELEKTAGELVQRESASRRAAERYRIIADNTYDWEFWLGPDAQFIYSSPSCERISGYLAEEFEADPTLFYRMIHPDDLARVSEHMNRRKFEAGLAEIEFRIVRRDGAVRWIALAFQPVYDGSSRFLGTRGSNRDVTERKLAEAEREKLIGELRSALSRVKLLSGLIPICACCKKIRDDKGYWNQIETYIRDHSEADFSHGICPECAPKEYPELFAEKEKRKK